jgi:putative inorganic carbon (hco3(-)) transporter
MRGRLHYALPFPPAAVLAAGVLVSAVAIGGVVARQPLLATAAVAVAGLAVAFLARPDLATATVLFLLMTNAVAVAVNYHGAPLTVAAFFPFLLIVPVAHHLYRGEPIVFTPAFAFLLLFFVAQLLSTIFSIDPDGAWEEVKTFIFEGLIVYFLLTNAVRTAATLRLVTWTLIAAGACLAAVTVFQELTATYTRPYGGFGQVGRDFLIGAVDNARLAGPFGDPNYYAQALMIVVTLSLLSVWTERALVLRVLALGITALMATAVSFTFSRGAAIAFLLVLVVMAFLRYLRTYQIVGIALGIFVLLTLVPEYRDRVSTLTNIGGATEAAGSSEAADVSVRGRTGEMLAAGLVFVDHPVIGVGPGVFPLYYQDYVNQTGLQSHEAAGSSLRRGEEAQREAHNIVLGLAADLGALGLVALGGMIAVTFRDLNRARRRWVGIRPDIANAATAMMLAILAYLVAGLFLTLAFERYLWMLLALGGCVRLIASREAAAAEAVART